MASLTAGDFYDSVTIDNKVMPRYGNDCSGFLSFSWNIPRKTTYDFTTGINNGTYAQVGSYGKNTETPNKSSLKQSYNYLKRGDGLVYRIVADGYYKPFAQSSTDGWYKINGYWFYYENNIEASGWKQIDGSWYYFLPQNHRMSTGWQLIEGVWYYLNPDNGAMHEGWLLDQNDWYYLKPGSGAMAANESIVIDGKTFFVLYQARKRKSLMILELQES